MWKEAIVAYLKYYPGIRLKGLEKTKTRSQDCGYLGRALDAGPPPPPTLKRQSSSVMHWTITFSNSDYGRYKTCSYS
jgi:hypothetical protein